MVDSDDELFEDAQEILTDSGLMDLETQLVECKAAVDLFFNNRFVEARALLTPWVGRSMYHTIGNAVLNFLEAVLTFDPELIQKASDSLKSSINLCNQYRRKNSFPGTFGRIVRKSNCDELAVEEIHAELCYAEAILLKSLLSFIEDETLMSFIKAGFKIRSCYNSYKECNNILKTRKWKNELHKIHFESGVHVGIGAFNLMISFLPNRIIKLLEFIGFSGSKETGIRELNKGYELNEGIRQVLSIMTLLTYNLFVLNTLSHEDGDLELCTTILQDQLQLYPDGAWFLYFKGRLEFIKGNISEANLYYSKSWKSQNIWPQFHHLCFWELMWTHCVSLNWKEAVSFASELLENSRWSRIIYAYQKISIFLMMPVLTLEEKQEITLLLRNIPKWRQRFAGKSIPMEKFCLKRCERYITQEENLVLPAIELLYLWNLFKVLGKKWDMCHAVYKLIHCAILELENGKYAGTFYEFDNKALLLLLKGACLFQMKSPHQAEDCLKQVLKLEKKVKEDFFIVPFSLVELAIIYHSQGLAQKALQTLDDVKKNYTGYSLETRLHFRIHAAIQDFSKNNIS